MSPIKSKIPKEERPYLDRLLDEIRYRISKVEDIDAAGQYRAIRENSGHRNSGKHTRCTKYRTGHASNLSSRIFLLNI